MTEREKMLAGEMYDPFDPERVAGRRRAHELCRMLNVAPEPQQQELRHRRRLSSRRTARLSVRFAGRGGSFRSRSRRFALRISRGCAANARSGAPAFIRRLLDHARRKGFDRGHPSWQEPLTSVTT